MLEGPCSQHVTGNTSQQNQPQSAIIWPCTYNEWCTREWRQLHGLQASPVVTLLSCVSLSMNTQPSVPAIYSFKGDMGNIPSEGLIKALQFIATSCIVLQFHDWCSYVTCVPNHRWVYISIIVSYIIEPWMHQWHFIMINHHTPLIRLMGNDEIHINIWTAIRSL